MEGPEVSTYAPEFRELSDSDIDAISGGGNWSIVGQAGIQGGIWGVAGYGAARSTGATKGQALKAGAWGFAAGAAGSAASGK